MRRWLTQAAVLVLVLPALLGLLPQPALSAASALERDLLMSVCGQDAPQQQGGGQHDTSHDHCVLCSSHCSGLSPSHAGAMPAFAARPRPSAGPVAAARNITDPLMALRDAIPPRGPPTRG